MDTQDHFTRNIDMDYTLDLRSRNLYLTCTYLICTILPCPLSKSTVLHFVLLANLTTSLTVY